MLRASALLGQGLQAVWSSLWSLGHSFSGVDSSDLNTFLLSAKVSKEENEQTLFMYHSTMHPILPIYCVTSLYWSPLPFLQEYPLPACGPFSPLSLHFSQCCPLCFSTVVRFLLPIVLTHQHSVFPVRQQLKGKQQGHSNLQHRYCQTKNMHPILVVFLCLVGN